MGSFIFSSPKRHTQKPKGRIQPSLDSRVFAAFVCSHFFLGEPLISARAMFSAVSGIGAGNERAWGR